MDHHVHCRQPWEDHCTCKLPEPALEQISLDRGPAMLRHHEPDSGMPGTRKGSAHPNVEMFGAKSLPCSRDLA
jgi:hypothetical protein